MFSSLIVHKCHHALVMAERKHIHFRIKEFSRLERTVGEQRSSEPMEIHQLSWKIVVKRELDEQARILYLGCYVQCEAQDNRISDWNCVASVFLIVQPQRPKKALRPLKVNFEENFSAGNNCFGNSRVKTINQLMYYEDCWYNEEQDFIILEAFITVNPPYFQFHDFPKNSQTKTLTNRMRNLLSTGKEADVHFLVGTGLGKEFSAHKGILTTVSDVFERMFQFDANNGNANRTVEVPDVTPEAFQVLLSYVYTGELDGLAVDNTFDVLYAAKKYDITELVDACANCPKLDVSNVLYALGKALFYEVKSLINRCWKFIDQNANAILESDEFLRIDQILLCGLFARDQLVLQNGEIAIWNAALRWLGVHCDNTQTPLYRREVLGPAFFKIRFPLIPKEQFASIIVPTKMLTNEEMLSVFLYHTHPTGNSSEYPLEFSSKFRARK